VFYNIVDTLSLFPSSIEYFHCYKHVLHLSLYIIILVFVYVFIFGSIFHIWEKTFSLYLSEPDLLHLTQCPPIASIYLQITCWPAFLFVLALAVLVELLPATLILGYLCQWLLLPCLPNQAS
jgi:hypothetical protein